jgi:hypothetical protein
MENINLDKIIKADELDTNMILSVPEEIGIQLQKIIQGQASRSDKESLQIEIIENPSDSMELEESRKLIFKINNTLLPVTLLDLPCIIEAKKTIDYKNFYKSGDVSQMMFVHDKEHQLNREEDIIKFDPFTAEDETFNKIIWKKDYDHRYKLRNGLGKGTKNIRSKRFKRKIRYNGDEILEVAKKLKMIIDNGAASFENQMKMEQSQNDEEMLKFTIGENQSERQSASENNQNFNLPAQNILPTQGISFNNFAVPHSRNSTIRKKNKGKVDKNGLNNSMNININLGQLNFGESATLKQNESMNINSSMGMSMGESLLIPQIMNIPLMSSFKIPTNDIDEEDFDNVNFNNNFEGGNITIDPEEQKLIEEYSNLKEEYKNVKSQLESNDNKDLQKLKKKIKKRLKEIKSIFKKDK